MECRSGDQVTLKPNRLVVNHAQSGREMSMHEVRVERLLAHLLAVALRQPFLLHHALCSFQCLALFSSKVADFAQSIRFSLRFSQQRQELGFVTRQLRSQRRS